MKKIFVDVYLAYNLGDDLFVDILAKNYPNAEFTLNYVGTEYDSFITKYKNIKRRKYKFLDKINQKLGIKDTLNDYKSIADNHDALLFIGGSIFRDEEYHEMLYNDRLKLVNEFKDLEKPVFVLGANFGPYKRESFLKDYKDFFNICEDVCFRDSYSFNLFKEIEQVRCEPDIVFQLDLHKFKKCNKNNKVIGFSIIDVNHKQGLASYYDDYLQSNIKTINLLVKEGYECCLASFCEKEGDLKVINKIMENLSEDTLKKVSVYEYKGELEEAFEKFSTFKLFIAARFHANIISQLLEVPVLPVIYSDKTSNMLKDIGLDGLMITMDSLNMQYNRKILLEKVLKNKVTLDKISEKSKNQFSKLTLFINDQE